MKTILKLQLNLRTWKSANSKKNKGRTIDEFWVDNPWQGFLLHKMVLKSLKKINDYRMKWFFFCTTKIFCLVFILEGYKIWSGLDLNFHPKKFQKLRKITIFEILNKKQYFIVSSEISYMRKIDNKGTYSQEGKQSQPIGCNHSFVANRYL